MTTTLSRKVTQVRQPASRAGIVMYVLSWSSFSSLAFAAQNVDAWETWFPRGVVLDWVKVVMVADSLEQQWRSSVW